jgi:hypothetical protein
MKDGEVLNKEALEFTAYVPVPLKKWFEDIGYS